MMTPEPGDPTPIVGAQTDIAPLGRAPGGGKPAHEKTADEEAGAVNWDAIAVREDFRSLLRAKMRFIIPATVFFMVYYFILPWSVGYYPEIMSKEVFGKANLAYVFALSQFFMAWILAAIYVRVAAGWDRRASEILSKLPHD